MADQVFFYDFDMYLLPSRVSSRSIYCMLCYSRVTESTADLKIGRPFTEEKDGVE